MYQNCLCVCVFKVVKQFFQQKSYRKHDGIYRVKQIKENVVEIMKTIYNGTEMGELEICDLLIKVSTSCVLNTIISRKHHSQIKR
jgi:hypothetical protein